MVLTYSNMRFMAFSALFVSVAAAAAFFIFPLLMISFICSGFVLLFTGLSYGSFRVASSHYNHTVLFLNRVLRKIADSIPPSVGYSEIKIIKIDRASFVPSFGILAPFKSLVLLPFTLLSYFNPFASKEVTELEPKPTEPITLEEVHETAAKVIYDDENENLLDVYLDNKTDLSPEKLKEEVVHECETDPVKLSDLNN